MHLAMYTHPLRRPGHVCVRAQVSLHVSRKYGFYEMKVLLPLVLLTNGSFLLMLEGADSIGERMELMFTMFLAAFALLYVVGETVPRVDFLTTIDRIIYLSLFVL